MKYSWNKSQSGTDFSVLRDRVYPLISTSNHCHVCTHLILVSPILINLFQWNCGLVTRFFLASSL